MRCLFIFLIILSSGLFADFDGKTRSELHWKYQKLSFGLKDYILYGRLEKAFNLPSDWQLYMRFDLPYIWLWGKQIEFVQLGEEGIIVDIPEANIAPVVKPFKEQGLSDISTKAFFVTPHIGNLTFGFGSEFAFPTAQKSELGTGKYSAKPMVGIKYDLPSLFSGSWTAFLLKYQFSYAGRRDRTSFRIFTMQPVLVFTFPKGWAFSLNSETQYNCKIRKWFVPISANIGKVFGRSTLCVQYQKGLITSFPVYKDDIEVILSYLF